MAAEEIASIVLRGRSEFEGDVVLRRAVERCLEIMGEAAYDASVSSVKPITGHCMGASGSVEALACVLAIRDQKVPPTINYTTPDPECDLDYVPNEAKSRRVRVAMSTSVGLGGHNSCLLFREVN